MKESEPNPRKNSNYFDDYEEKRWNNYFPEDTNKKVAAYKETFLDEFYYSFNNIDSRINIIYNYYTKKNQNSYKCDDIDKVIINLKTRIKVLENFFNKCRPILRTTRKINETITIPASCKIYDINSFSVYKRMTLHDEIHVNPKKCDQLVDYDEYMREKCRELEDKKKEVSNAAEYLLKRVMDCLISRYNEYLKKINKLPPECHCKTKKKVSKTKRSSSLMATKINENSISDQNNAEKPKENTEIANDNNELNINLTNKKDDINNFNDSNILNLNHNENFSFDNKSVVKRDIKYIDSVSENLGFNFTSMTVGAVGVLFICLILFIFKRKNNGQRKK